MARVRYPATIPGAGVYVVGVDIVPGRYVHEGAGNWTRFPGKGDAPCSGTAAEVVIEADDLAFEAGGPGPWHRDVVPEAAGSVHSGTLAPREPRWPVFDPAFRPAVAAEICRLGVSGLQSRRTHSLMDRLPKPLGSALAALLGWWSSTAAAVLAMVYANGDLLDLDGLLGIAGGCLGFSLFMDLAKGQGIKRWGKVRDVIRAQRVESRFRAAWRDGRVLIRADVAPEHAGLLGRAQDAIRTILDSEVNKAGLLDSLDNAMTLREQEWEIARTLAGISRWESERETEPSAQRGLQETLAEEDEALAEVLASVTGRVEALEAYAWHVVEADLAHRAHEQLLEAVERSQKYLGLVAESARDTLAIAQIERLDEHARMLRQALGDSLAGAAEIDLGR